MSSLQEQLLKAGLVDKNKLNMAEKEKQKRSNQSRKAAGKSATRKVDPKKVAADKRHAERVARDRAFDEKRKQGLEQKAIAAQVKQLIETNKVDRSKGEIPYSFVYRKKIKKMFIGETEKNLLTGGRLAIVTTVVNNEGRRFELVPMEVARKIAERDAETVIELNDEDTTTSTDDDPYADYKIPDDLTW
ncbi:MAG: DUF2058 domain-containing protein [Gammaproteobacteria bacterium]|nr:DUF2058 domain-containing protein [Gammaproteobacteria bacterium]